MEFAGHHKVCARCPIAQTGKVCVHRPSSVVHRADASRVSSRGLLVHCAHPCSTAACGCEPRLACNPLQTRRSCGKQWRPDWDEAACVRNLDCPQMAGGCVHRILEAADFTCCRWTFIERPPARLSLAVALRLPPAQRCEMCWPPLQASSSSSSSGSSGPASTSCSVSQNESEDSVSSESLAGMPL